MLILARFEDDCIIFARDLGVSFSSGRRVQHAKNSVAALPEHGVDQPVYCTTENVGLMSSRRKMV